MVEGLASVTNAMVDLMKLSKRHHIEGRLYNGDALDILYGMLGERRVTSWLEKIYDNELKYDDEMEDEELWKKLIKFLEKELKLEQEKLLIKRRLDGSRQAAESGRAGSYWSLEQADNSSEICGWCNSHYEDRRSLLSNGESGGSKRCSFCNEVEHVETNGPRGSSLIQYFACQNFVEMTPAQRYQELRSKELCFQCLYPGANQSYGPHRDGSCQKDFVCKHSSHERYPLKKHVLVCHEHRNTDENKNLAEYKQKLILYQTKLPIFSKDIKLSFVAYTTYAYTNSRR